MIINEYIPPQLHPDLQPYLAGDELHHPLIEIDGGVWPALYHRINQLYEYKLKNSIDPEPPNEWQSYLPHLSIFDRQHEFITKELGREDPEYFRIVGQIWTDRESLGCTSGTLELLLLKDFRAVASQNYQLLPNVIHIMTAREREKLAGLPDRCTVYRGHDYRLLHEISWTIDPQIAMQYALGLNCGGERCLSTGTVSKQHAIAYIDRWNESEIIVPSNFVENIETTNVKSERGYR